LAQRFIRTFERRLCPDCYVSRYLRADIPG
jgi:hypothetical protein